MEPSYVINNSIPNTGDESEPAKKTAKSDFKEGWKLFKHSLAFLFRRPVFLLPIFMSWGIVAAVVLLLRYYWVFPDDLGFGYLILFGIGVMFVIAYSIVLANVVMLELIQQIQRQQPTSFSKAFLETISLDSLKIVPISLVWAIIWFLILIVKVLTSKKRENSNKPEPSLKDAAITLSGASNPFSWIGLGLNLFSKLVRMVVFLSLPAIAWENKGPFSAFKTSFQIIKKHPIHFITSFTLTEVAGLLMALPLIPITILGEMEVEPSDFIWLLVIIYEGIIWTLGIYLEQMTLALLYQWHLKWVAAGGVGDLDPAQRPNYFEEIMADIR